LVRKTHISWNPFGFVHHLGWDLLPHISRYVVAFNCIYDFLLVNSTTESKHVVVLKRTQANTRSWYPHFINHFPFVLLSIILFAVPIHFIIEKRAYYIYKALNRAYRVVCVRKIHVLNLD
jgi:hypothetical protein